MAKKTTSKKILVTGGTGFLGTHLVKQLIEAGEKHVRVMASSVPEWMKDCGIEAFEGSVSLPQDVAGALEGVSAIFHLAGMVSRDNSDAIVMNEIHLQGTRILCEAAREVGVKSIVLASSSGTIALSKEPEIFDESFEPRLDLITRFAYYTSKYYQEKIALREFDGEGRKLVIMNPSLLLGEGDERFSSTKPILDFLARKIPFTPKGGLNFVDAADAAGAFISGLESGNHQEKYLLGAENMTFADLFGKLERLSGVAAPMLQVPRSVAVPAAGIVDSLFSSWKKTPPVEVKEVEQAEMFWYFSSQKAKDELGFSPRDPQETLNNTIRYIKQYFLGGNLF